MYILAGETRVDITSYNVMRHDNKRGVVLTVKTTADNISLADLDTLCMNIAANRLDILVYDDDGLAHTLRGFYHNCICSKDSNGVLTAEITNESENTYQIGILKDRSTNLETATENQGRIQEELMTAVLDQSEVLAEQTENVALLAEASEMQTMTMESLMLEVLPELMAATVEEAVARALEANSNPEAETSVEE